MSSTPSSGSSVQPTNVSPAHSISAHSTLLKKLIGLFIGYFIVLRLWSDCYSVFGDEIEPHYVEGCLGIADDDFVSSLQCDSEAMVMEVSLEPVVWMVPVTQIADVAYLDDLQSVFVCVLFHLIIF